MKKSNRQLKKERKKNEKDNLELEAKIKAADTATQQKYAKIRDYHEYINGKFVKVVLMANIYQYDKDSDLKLNEYSGTFENIFKKINNFHAYYYRFKKYADASQDVVKSQHFNVEVSDIASLYIDEADIMNRRLNYYINNLYETVDGQEICPNRLLNDLAYLYFDYKVYLDMFKQRNTLMFAQELNAYLSRNIGFKEIKDLNDLNHVSGMYLLILDEYHTFYIGESEDMKAEIMMHWSKRDYYRGHGIDLFKAKDTTRIYALATKLNRNEIYDKLCADEFAKLSLNRSSNGKFEGISLNDLLSNNQNKTEIDYHDLYQMVNQNKNIFM